MTRLAVVILLLTSLLWAETQEDAYFRAMKAEEAGDITLAVKAFEDAVALPGPYTEELREILKSYYEALGIKNDGESGSLSFRFLGDVGFDGLRYDDNGSDSSEYGGDLFVTLTPFLDYSRGDWLHSFGFEVSGDWFLMNDNMPALDTSDWNLSLGLDYSLVGTSFMVNLGGNLNLAEKEDASYSLFAWLQKEFYKRGKNRFGVALWGYYKSSGPLSSALYATWNRTSPYGLNGSAFLGARVEADSVLDYKQSVANYQNAMNQAFGEAMEAWTQSFYDGTYTYDETLMTQCMETYGDENYCYTMVDSLQWAKISEAIYDTLHIPAVRSYAFWLGPSLRSRISYKFRTGLTLEAKLNLFYGFVMDGPDDDYKKIQKLSGTWGATLYWKRSFWKVYLGLEQIYRHYWLPEYYEDIYSGGSFLTELKAGVKWEL